MGLCCIPLAARLSASEYSFVHDCLGEDLDLWFYSNFPEAADLERPMRSLELYFIGRFVFTIWRHCNLSNTRNQNPYDLLR
jgi:hypothetical protein